MANYEVSPETNKIIKEYAERIGCKPEEGVERLVKTAASRKASLIKYAAENPRPKAEKKTKAKKVAPKGTSLAKKKAAPKARAKKAKALRAIDVVSGDEQAPV